MTPAWSWLPKHNLSTLPPYRGSHFFLHPDLLLFLNIHMNACGHRTFNWKITIGSTFYEDCGYTDYDTISKIVFMLAIAPSLMTVLHKILHLYCPSSTITYFPTTKMHPCTGPSHATSYSLKSETYMHLLRRVHFLFSIFLAFVLKHCYSQVLFPSQYTNIGMVFLTIFFLQILQ